VKRIAGRAVRKPVARGPGPYGAIRRGVALYNAGRFWEAHEALETVWRRSAPPERALWQGLIQAAAAMLHRERGNRHGLLALGRAAARRLAAGAPEGFPVETARFVQGLVRCVEDGGPVPVMAYTPEPAVGQARPRTKDA
jgi:uncharacterized protein